MSSDLKIALVGAGNIANEHLKVIDYAKNIRVTYIYSRTKNNIIKKKNRYSIENYSTNINEFKNFLKLKKVDGIIIAVSVNSMFSTIREFITFKIPMLIEKPPCLSNNELNKLIKLSNKFKTPNMIGLNRRYYSIFNQLKNDIIKKNIDNFFVEGHENIWKIKKPKEIINKWLYANSIHTIDLLFFLGYSPAKKIFTLKSKKNKYPNINLAIRFKNEILGQYSSNWNNYGRWSITVNSNHKKYIFKPLESGFIINKNGDVKTLLPSKEDLLFKPGFYNQIKSFINLIKTSKNKWPDVNLCDLQQIYNLLKKLS